ncbi:MAG: hypothetical protein M0Z88_04020 [Actinomycetota bacterium]|nr:hypothetical protein [Actinomycetota bacterium]
MRSMRWLAIWEAHRAREKYWVVSHYEAMRYRSISETWGLHSHQAAAAYRRYRIIDEYLAGEVGEAYAAAGLSVTK